METMMCFVLCYHSYQYRFKRLRNKELHIEIVNLISKDVFCCSAASFMWKKKELMKPNIFEMKLGQSNKMHVYVRPFRIITPVYATTTTKATEGWRQKLQPITLWLLFSFFEIFFFDQWKISSNVVSN